MLSTIKSIAKTALGIFWAFYIRNEKQCLDYFLDFEALGRNSLSLDFLSLDLVLVTSHHPFSCYRLILIGFNFMILLKGAIGIGLFRQKKPEKVMKSDTLSHSVEVITLVFFAFGNQLLAGISKIIFGD